MPAPTPDQKKDLYTLILLVAIIGIILIVTVVLLFRAWRRNVLRAKRKHQQEMMPDIWRAGADRLPSPEEDDERREDPPQFHG
ncbi:MAG: hypothetical protein WD768_05415 [Phycisphaeraceae bacterium]